MRRIDRGSCCHILQGMSVALICLFAPGYPKEEREIMRTYRERKTGFHVVGERPALFVGSRLGVLVLLRSLVQCRLLSPAMSPS